MRNILYLSILDVVLCMLVDNLGFLTSKSLHGTQWLLVFTAIAFRAECVSIIMMLLGNIAAGTIGLAYLHYPFMLLLYPLGDLFYALFVVL